MPDTVPGPNTDLAQLVAAAADLCRKPWRHAVLPAAPAAADGVETIVWDDCCLWLEVRTAEGERRPEHDLELEIYRSGATLHLTMAWRHGSERPMLWHGRHAVWMSPESGERCERPDQGACLEALARRLRALLTAGP